MNRVHGYKVRTTLTIKKANRDRLGVEARRQKRSLANLLERVCECHVRKLDAAKDRK